MKYFSFIKLTSPFRVVDLLRIRQRMIRRELPVRPALPCRYYNNKEYACLIQPDFEFNFCIENSVLRIHRLIIPLPEIDRASIYANSAPLFHGIYVDIPEMGLYNRIW